MFRKMKKILFIVPCLIFCFFLFNGSKTLAADAKLLDSTAVYVGSQNKANTYYFTNDVNWELKASFSAIKEWDTYLQWRVVRPDGKATAWSKKDYYVDNNGKFTIGNYTKLAYTSTDSNFGKRVSVVPEATYYVDIQYYGQLVFSWKQDKDETIKIVVANDTAVSSPLANISYSKATSMFTISAFFENPGYSLISSVKYFFADSSTQISTPSDFKNAYSSASSKKEISKINAGEYETSIAANSSKSKLFVLVTTPHGYETVVSYDINSDTEGPNNQGTNPDFQQNQNDNGSGLFDYDLGQLILIVLVIVLVVSCALIITQKIVDYKKRLY